MKPGLRFGRGKTHSTRWAAALALWFAGVAVSHAQETNTPNSPAPAAATKNTSDEAAAKTSSETKAELSSRDTAPTFKLRVNLVQVRVVVRDGKGNLIPDLKKEDFLLYDQGKLQTISTFDVETAKTRQERAAAAAKTQQQALSGEGSEEDKEGLPERFVALVFDDIHLNLTDAVAVRASAQALIDALSPSDRMAIYGTSGELNRDFTGDKAALTQTLLQVIPRPKMGKANAGTNCPDVNHYMADQYVNKSNAQILGVVTQETLDCQFQGNLQMISAATLEAQLALRQELVAGDTDNSYTYRVLEDVMRRMTAMPGERILVLASPGFLLTTQHLDEMDIVDRANRASIVINTVDARGLYAPDVGGDISLPSSDTVLTAGYKNLYRTSEQTEDAYVLMDFANGTGGTFFQNSNDLAGGLKRAGASPEISYMLGFSPLNPKMDGRFHSIKVTMANKQQKYDLQARRGYYAPKKAEDPQEQAKQEIAEAVFSQEEIHELPLDLQTQYFKSTDTEARLSVVSRIDVKGVHFRKVEGRHFDSLTIATAIFDENGNYVTGGEKLLEMRLLDKTYDRLSQTGLTMKSSFDIKPGKYMVRQVIRDSEGARMAARNGAVVIPF